jgi:hypothetical protein
MTDVADFFRSSLDQIIDLRHLLAILASRLPWRELEVAAEDDRREMPRPFCALYLERSTTRYRGWVKMGALFSEIQIADLQRGWPEK